MPLFDTAKLDTLMEQANLDVIVATSKHNVQYLTDGHRFFFFDYMDAIGVSRYLPVVVYVRGDLPSTGYIANVMESWQLDVAPIWISQVSTSTWGVQDAVAAAITHIKTAVGNRRVRVGIEGSFLPVEAYLPLLEEKQFELADAQFALERLRASKRPDELVTMRKASELIIDSMAAVLARCGEGHTKREIVEEFRREQTNRGLVFEYCLVSMGPSHNRAPSEQSWNDGDVLCLDSGGNLGGYIGDLARMGVLGQPDSELVDLLAEVEAIQQAARQPIRRGAVGQEIFDAALAVKRRSPHDGVTTFVGHGMGLISHEAPRLTHTGPVPYPATDAPLPLEVGMVLSIETTMLHPTRGFIKIEDTVAVTETGYEAFGDHARNWTRSTADSSALSR